MKLKPRKYTGMDNIRVPLLYSPTWASVHMVLALLTNLSLLFQVFATSQFVNKSLQAIQGTVSWTLIIWPGILLGILVTWDKVSKPVIKGVQCKLENDLRRRYRTDITQKRAKMKYSYMEDNDTWDLILRVTKDPENTIIRGLLAIEGLLGIAIQTLGIFTLIFFNAWWVAILCIGVSIPMIIFAMKGGRAQYEADRKVANLERRYEYLSDILLNRDSVSERELFGMINQLSSTWLDYYHKVRNHKLIVEFKWYVKQKSSGIIFSMMTVMIALALIDSVVSGDLSKGLYIALIQGVTQLISRTVNIPRHVNDLTKGSEYYRDITVFANIPETVDALVPPACDLIEFQSLEFRNVSFSYPGTSKKVLDNMSFKMTKGKHYAIVGINGAGKTTLIKLITGLYGEFDGEILINDKSIHEYSQSQLKGLLAVLFQDFARYSISLRDNIAIGDVPNMNNKDMDSRVLEEIKRLELNHLIDELEDGIYTHLGKVNRRGQDISGGQWQRVAMARTMLSSASLHILDEPTAALDPISESAIYSEFDRISDSTTTIFISHRLGSTKLADEILVINNGKVCEQGTHRDLMNYGGVYAEMYNSQRSWYQ